MCLASAAEHVCKHVCRFSLSSPEESIGGSSFRLPRLLPTPVWEFGAITHNVAGIFLRGLNHTYGAHVYVEVLGSRAYLHNM